MATAGPLAPIMEGTVIPRRQKGQHGHDPKPVTFKNWPAFIGRVAAGMPVIEARKLSGISIAGLEGALRTDPKLRQEYEDAKTAALWMQWDSELLEHIMAKIAMGSTVRAAVQELEWDDSAKNRELSFYKLLLRDATVKEMYDQARMIQAEKMAIDDLIEIADDNANDETWDGKPNSAAVNRSRLMVDARKWTAAKLHFSRFGDKLEQNINANVVVDHAARLEEARKRKEALNKAREKADGKTK